MNTAIRPRVSVVIITRNNGSTLRHAIESVIWQTFVNFEVWVIGAKCTDHSENVVHSFCDPRLFWYNAPDADSDLLLTIEGLKRSRGEYIAYLSDVDIWLPNHLESLVESIIVTNADVVCSITHCIQDDGSSFVSIPMLPETTVLPHQSSVVHKKNCVFISLFEGNRQYDYTSFFFHRAKEESLPMEVVPVTTGLRFLAGRGGRLPQLQSFYMERLRKDSDFINKELSTILLQKERSRQVAGEESSWSYRLGRSLLKLVSAFLGKSTKLSGVKGFKREPNLSLVPKKVKAI